MNKTLNTGRAEFQQCVMRLAHVFEVDADEAHVAGVLAVHAVLLVHQVVAGELQVHQLAVGLQ